MKTILITTLGETSPEAYESASKQGDVLHLSKEVESNFGNLAVINSSSNYIQEAIRIAKSKKYNYLYLMNGFSILNKGCLDSHFDKDTPKYDISYSDHYGYIKDSNQSPRLVYEYLLSFDPANIPKYEPIINNLLINVDKVKDQPYYNPYHVLLENGLNQTCGHIPQPLYQIDIEHRANTLIPDMRKHYAKLYLQW